MMPKGWISLHRKILHHPFYPSREKRAFTKYEAWLDLLLNANHTKNKVLVGNEFVDLKEGQILTSQRDLANRWKWTRRKVRLFLINIERAQMLAQERAHLKTLLSIVNWDFYQSDILKRVHEGAQRGPTKGPPTPKKDKEINVLEPPNNDNNVIKNVRPVIFECLFFNVDEDYFKKLKSDYPALSEERIISELKKLEDYVSDNRKKYHFRATGQLKNPKLNIRNWMERVIVKPSEATTPQAPTEMDIEEATR